MKSRNAPQRSRWTDGSSVLSDFVPTVAHCRHVITLQRDASSATDPDRSQLIQADSSLAAREASEERRNDVTGSSLRRASAANASGLPLRRRAWPADRARMGGRGFCKFFRPINAKCRGIAAPTCRTRAAHSPLPQMAQFIFYSGGLPPRRIRTAEISLAATAAPPPGGRREARVHPE